MLHQTYNVLVTQLDDQTWLRRAERELQRGDYRGASASLAQLAAASDPALRERALRLAGRLAFGDGVPAVYWACLLLLAAIAVAYFR